MADKLIEIYECCNNDDFNETINEMLKNAEGISEVLLLAAKIRFHIQEQLPFDRETLEEFREKFSVHREELSDHPLFEDLMEISSWAL